LTNGTAGEKETSLRSWKKGKSHEGRWSNSMTGTLKTGVRASSMRVKDLQTVHGGPVTRQNGSLVKPEETKVVGNNNQSSDCALNPKKTRQGCGKAHKDDASGVYKKKKSSLDDSSVVGTIC